MSDNHVASLEAEIDEVRVVLGMCALFEGRSFTETKCTLRTALDRTTLCTSAPLTL
jgi:hypothetical protein